MADIDVETTPPVQEEATKTTEEPVAPAQDESTMEEPLTTSQAKEQPPTEPVQPTAEEQPQANNNETEQEVTTTSGGDKVESIVQVVIEAEQGAKTVPALSGRELKKLVIGMDLNKIKKGKLLGRYYSITEDLVRLTWNSKRKTILKAQIPLSQIQDVILGNNTGFTQYDSSCCFTIVYVDGGHDRTLDLMASTSEQAELWVNGLLAIIGTGVTDDTNEHRKKWLRFLFDEADENGDGTLDLKEIIQMMKRLNVGVSNKIIKRKFKEADTSGNGDNKLDFDEFIQLFNEFSERPDIRRIFNLHASADNGTNMSVEDLLLFLKSVQNLEGADEDYCRGIIEKFEPSEDGKNKNLLSLDGFTQYMLSHDNDIFKREHRQIYQDMSRPLSHYFIASSHNTYLEADQISGPSSIDCYIRALNDGCRCVELDCWDGDNDEPVIYHGHTLTSKILFKDVITAIKDNAFNSSDYPVILSIENHCSINQQFVMATYMSDIFGDMLFKDSRDPDRKELPSPAELRNKILVKAKKLPAELEDKSDNEGEVSDEDEAAEIDPEEIKKVRASSPPQKTPATETTPGEAAPSQATEGTTPEIIEVPPPPEVEPQPEQELRKVVDSGGTKASRRKSFNKKRPETVSKPKAKRKLSSKLSKCVNYVQSVHFKGFDEITNIPYYQMSSFGESSAFRYSDELANEFIEYNKTHLSRTYPAGKRIDSSNYEPIRLWNAGCQIGKLWLLLSLYLIILFSCS
jgi:Ca2+-binding EF-hand superfamily protein